MYDDPIHPCTEPCTLDPVAEAAVIPPSTNCSAFELNFNRLPYIDSHLYGACASLNRTCINSAFPRAGLDAVTDDIPVADLPLAGAKFSFPWRREDVGNDEGRPDGLKFMLFLCGNPAFFSIQSGLMVTEDGTRLAFNVDEYTTGQLLYTEIQSLNLATVVDLVARVLNAATPKLPRDAFAIEQIKIGISPFGASFCGTDFPHGCSFETETLLFGKRAGLSCIVDRSRVSLCSAVDEFTLGPLSVCGTLSPRAVFECDLGTATQHLLVDGSVSLFAAEGTMRILVDVLPSPRLDIFARAKLSDLLLLQVNNGLVGPLTLSNLRNVDYVFDTRFEQRILQRLRESTARITSQVAQDVSDRENAEASRLRKGKFRATSDSDPSQPPWNEKTKRVISAYIENIDKFQNNITAAQKDYDGAMAKAQDALDKANSDRAHTLKSAKLALLNAQRDMVESIEAAQRRVDDVQKELDATFGSAHEAIENARRDVRNLRNQINDVYSKIHDYQHADPSEWRKKAAIPGLYTAAATLEASKAAADGVLISSQAVLSSSNYVIKMTAFQAAHGALEAAKASGMAGVVTARGGLLAADAASKLVVDAAKVTVETTRLGVEYVALRGVKGALRFFKSLNGKAFQAAIKAIIRVLHAATPLYTAVRCAARLARKLGEDILLLVGRVLVFAMSLFDIQVVRLSGSLRGIIGMGGEMSKPLLLCIEGMIACQPVRLQIGGRRDSV